MISDVSIEKDRFEGLKDYVINNKRSPVDVPTVVSRPRLENRPGEKIPAPKSKIPTSSQRPGKQTNQHIVYGRYCREDSRDDPVTPGDVVMLNKTRYRSGHDTNRSSTVASFRQVNTILALKSRETGTVLDASLKNEIIKAREFLLRGGEDGNVDGQGRLGRGGMGQEIDRLQDDVKFIERRSNTLAKKTVTDSLTEVNKQFQDLLEDTEKMKNEGSGSARFFPFVDWMCVPVLSDWIPDGILLSRDDDEYNADYYKAGGGDAGIMMNVVVQGPTFARNSSKNSVENRPDEFMQLFDPEASMCDQLYIVLICEEIIEATTFKGYSFRYKPTSSRILEELGKSAWNNKPHTLTYDEATNVVAAWRVGVVMDNKTTLMSDSKITMNVSIDYASAYSLRKKCGEHVAKNRLIGQSLS